jgi:O-acetylserine/cysteine efflux transporter
VVWANLFAAPLLLLMSLVFEGPTMMVDSMRHATLLGWAGLLWQTIANTMFAYAAWGWLLARHPAAVVAPMSLLVPILGMTGSAWLVGEPMPAWKFGAAALILGALAINLLWPQIVIARKSQTARQT